MTLPELCKACADTSRPRLERVRIAARVADICRRRAGMNYNHTAEYVRSRGGPDAEEWEALLYEAEDIRSLIDNAMKEAGDG